MASRLLVVASVAFAGLGLADADAAERRLDDGSGVKIYGGDDAPKKYQWMTRFNGCGGALVSSNAVMTAAHCVDSGARTRMTIGAYDLEDPDAVSWNAEVRDTARVAIHPDWGRKGEGDIALVFFDKPVNLEPIKLGRRDPSVGSKVYVTGWESFDKILQQAEIFILRDGACGGGFYPDTELCAGRSDASQHTCSGDSGAPLFQKDDGDYVAYGVLNRGPACPGTHDVYASVAAYRDWLDEELGTSEDDDEEESTVRPASRPTAPPTKQDDPGYAPSPRPQRSYQPTERPQQPTQRPQEAMRYEPTQRPNEPTQRPQDAVRYEPTYRPSRRPSGGGGPSREPSRQPSENYSPTYFPTKKPSKK